MRRKQLIELTDIPWWPATFKCLLTDFLHLYTVLIRPFSPKLNLIRTAIGRSSTNAVVDLCAGSGGPWPELLQDLNIESAAIGSVTLTDLNPNPEAAERLNRDEGIGYYPTPVDARNVPLELKGCRTIFDGFHHFPPAEARKILQDAVNQGEPIVIFEILRRTIPDLMPMLFAFVHVWLLTPLIRPFSWRRLFFTYALPIAPIAIAFDGSVSILRCYSPDELMQMAKSTEGAQNYEWHAGDYKKWGMFPVTYLVGMPKVETH